MRVGAPTCADPRPYLYTYLPSTSPFLSPPLPQAMYPADKGLGGTSPDEASLHVLAPHSVLPLCLPFPTSQLALGLTLSSSTFPSFREARKHDPWPDQVRGPHPTSTEHSAFDWLCLKTFVTQV